MITTLFFDLWGTLLENGIPSPLQQTHKLLAPRMPFSAFVVAFEDAVMKRKFATQEELFTTAITALGVAHEQFVVDKLIGLWNKHRLLAKPYTDTLAGLKELREDYTLVLVSNTDCFVESVLDKFNIRSYFDHVLLSSEIGLLKTDTALFEKGLTLAKAKAQESVMIGDSLITDVKSAQVAGLHALLMDRYDRRDYTPKVIAMNQIKKAVGSIP